MAVHSLTQGAPASAAALGTLASATYLFGAAIDLGADVPPLLTVRAFANANGAPAGGKQLLVFAKWSLDNVDWTSGPETGTDTTNEADLHRVMSLPMNDTNDHRKEIDIRPKARYVKFGARNDSGVALTDGSITVAKWYGNTV